jgi:hypothetical protein
MVALLILGGGYFIPHPFMYCYFADFAVLQSSGVSRMETLRFSTHLIEEMHLITISKERRVALP